MNGFLLLKKYYLYMNYCSCRRLDVISCLIFLKSQMKLHFLLVTESILEGAYCLPKCQFYVEK